jgi:ribosomal-protein-alanine N-acetyltransferase
VVPTLTTPRLALRPFCGEDAPAVQAMASVYEVALNATDIPHPYQDGAAARWIATHQQAFDERGVHHFAIDDHGTLVGAMTLSAIHSNTASLDYWIGMPYWNRGYATEAAVAVIRYGFERCGFARICAAHYGRNPASGRVMEKAGMLYEGTLRKHMVKWGGERLDVVMYGALAGEWLAAHRVPA